MKGLSWLCVLLAPAPQYLVKWASAVRGSLSVPVLPGWRELGSCPWQAVIWREQVQPQHLRASWGNPLWAAMAACAPKARTLWARGGQIIPLGTRARPFRERVPFARGKGKCLCRTSADYIGCRCLPSRITQTSPAGGLGQPRADHASSNIRLRRWGLKRLLYCK